MAQESGQRIGIVGATGLIGSALAERLEAAGHEVVRFSRNPPAGAEGWRRLTEQPDLGGLDAVVNVAGESVAARWTKARWERIRSSRIDLTERLVEALAALPESERPRVLVNASASGYYGPRGDEELDEAQDPGDDRLARLCRDWEAAAVGAEAHGVRVVRVRIGLVLAPEAEAWRRLRTVFRLGIGGRLGSGRQWMPWIALADVTGALAWVVGDERVRGPVNLSAPAPVRNTEFTRRVAAALRRPAFLFVPGLALRLMMGGFADALLGSIRMVPGRLVEAGYAFRHPDLDTILRELAE